MKRLYFIFALLVTFSGYAWASAQPEPTQIVHFEVAEGTPVKEGKCWTESLAAPRKGAWRCMVGNEIYDPCFETSSSQMVICNMDPAKNKTGFSMKLTEPLPKSRSSKTIGHQPFQMRLTDGSVCAPFTGTRMPLGKEMIVYGCKSAYCPTLESCQVGVLSIDRHKSQWIANVVVYQVLKNGKIEVKALQKVPVETVWE